MYKVGADIESICGKCGDVWHVVVALVEGKIAKVQCKQCGGQHRYRPPGGVAPAKKSRTKREGSPGGSSRKRSSRKLEQPLVEPDLSRPVRSYKMSESFAAGDRLSHKVFGEGVVEQVIGLGKIQVFFPAGRKVLAHEKTAP